MSALYCLLIHLDAKKMSVCRAVLHCSLEF